MKQRPILMSEPMVRAILAGTKSQTRRFVKPQPSETFDPPMVDWYQRTLVDKRTGEQYPDPVLRYGAADENEDYPCPFGAPGDFLWVRETFAKNEVFPLCDRPEGDFIYRAGRERWSAQWTPSIHMPRRASRILLEIVGVSCERLQDIPECDAVAEGVAATYTVGTYQITGDRYTVEVVEGFVGGIPKTGDKWQGQTVQHVMHRPPVLLGTARDSYRRLWEKLNGPGSWAANPWVWCVAFRRVGGGA